MVYVLVGVGVMLAFITRIAAQAVQSRADSHKPKDHPGEPPERLAA